MSNDTTPVDSNRADSLIKLYELARQRFSELEKLYWKVNFSIWGFLAAVAYFCRPVDNQPARHLGWLAMILVFAVPIHFEFLRRLSASQSGWRSAATHFRDEASKLLDVPSPLIPASEKVSGNDSVWSLLLTATTTLIAAAVMRLVW